MTIANCMDVLGNAAGIRQHVHLRLDTPLRATMTQIRHNTDDAEVTRTLASYLKRLADGVAAEITLG